MTTKGHHIRPFVACLRAGNEAGHVCPDSVLVLRRKLAEVDGYIGQLTELRQQLRAQLDHAVEQRESPLCQTQICLP